MNTPIGKDEADAIQAMLAGGNPRDIAKDLGIPLKRMAYLCAKWSRQGWYEWGVNILRGWVVPGRHRAVMDRARAASGLPAQPQGEE